MERADGGRGRSSGLGLRLGRPVGNAFAFGLLCVLIVALLVAFSTATTYAQSPETLTATYSVISVSGTSFDTGYISSGDFGSDSFRTGIDFDTTVIPDNATITKVELKLFIDEEDLPLNNDVGKMTNSANSYFVASDEAGHHADVDGNEYLSDSGGFAGTGSHTVELLAAARTDLQSQLGANNFSVGFTGTLAARGRSTFSELRWYPPMEAAKGSLSWVFRAKQPESVRTGP